MSRVNFTSSRSASGSPTHLNPDAEYQASTPTGGPLARLYQSLAEFTELTDCLRQRVDKRLATHLTVTGWSNGILRVRLDQPALATRWRFQEPALRRQLTALPKLRALQDIRLVITPASSRPASMRTAPSRLTSAPASALDELAKTESHELLRKALRALANAALAAHNNASHQACQSPK